MQSGEKRFASDVTLDEAFFRANAHYMLSDSFYRKRLILLAVIAVLCMAAYLWSRQTLFLIYLAIYAVLWFVIHFRYQKKAVDTQIQRMKENAPSGQVEMSLCCTDEGVLLENHLSGGSATFAYADITHYVETDRWLILASRAGQFFAFDKTNIADGGHEALMAFIREKCPDIKRRR